MANVRIVKHAMISHVDEAGVQRHALRGQRVELTDSELARLEAADAVAPEDEADAITASNPVIPPATPDEVLARGAQADDAGAAEEKGETTETARTDTDAAASRSSRRGKSASSPAGV